MSYSFGVSSNQDPWFRVGGVEVGTTVFVVMVNVAMMLVWAIEGGSGPIHSAMQMFTPQVAAGQIWRLVTWPFATVPDIWNVLGVVVFYMFGIGLEAQIGKRLMAVMLVGFTLTLSLLAMLIHFVGLPSGLIGIDSLERMVLFTWIATWPTRPFFFGIPAWVVGVVFIGLRVLQDLGSRNFAAVAIFFASLLICAMIARSVGLLTQYDFIPFIKIPDENERARKRRAKERENRAQDSARLDELLEKIALHGMDSLSASERRELMKLRERRGE